MQYTVIATDSGQEALYHELNYFHAQITPHFLYNTLNTIIGLSYKDEEETRKALRHLSTYFRAKLDIYQRNEEVKVNQAYAVFFRKQRRKRNEDYDNYSGGDV